jgi:hypothetical protein
VFGCAQAVFLGNMHISWGALNSIRAKVEVDHLHSDCD